MEERIIFRQLLGELKEKAEQNGGRIGAEEVRAFLGHAGLSDDQFRLVFEYLTDQKIKVEGFSDSRVQTGGFGDYREMEESQKETAWGETDQEDQALEDPAREETAQEDSAKDQAGPSILELYLEEVYALKQVDPLIELEIYHKAADGDQDAREQILASLLPLVCDLAGEMDKEGVSPEDLIQEGNMELWTALEELEHQDTLAAYQARLMNRVGGAMEAVLKKAADERDMDLGMVNKVRHLDEAIRGLKEELGRRPTAEELSAFLDMPLEEILRILQLASG